MEKLHYAVMILVLGALMFTAGYQFGQMNHITWATCYDTLVGQ